jgi:hypothetical protein
VSPSAAVAASARIVPLNVNVRIGGVVEDDEDEVPLEQASSQATATGRARRAAAMRTSHEPGAPAYLGSSA